MTELDEIRLLKDNINKTDLVVADSRQNTQLDRLTVVQGYRNIGGQSSTEFFYKYEDVIIKGVQQKIRRLYIRKLSNNHQVVMGGWIVDDDINACMVSLSRLFSNWHIHSFFVYDTDL